MSVNESEATAILNRYKDLALIVPIYGALTWAITAISLWDILHFRVHSMVLDGIALVLTGIALLASIAVVRLTDWIGDRLDRFLK